jgi:sugar/nucleoside kinase (ribokinase family)
LRKKIVVLGNLNVDYLLAGESFAEGKPLKKENPLAGGTAYNAAYAFSLKGFQPILIGNVGKDREGDFIQRTLKNNKLNRIIHVHPHKPTGTCHIVYFHNKSIKKRYIRNKNDANEYDLDFLGRALDSAGIQTDDIIFIASDFFVRQDLETSKSVLKTVFKHSTKIVLDVVPHTIYKKLTLQEFRYIVDGYVHVMIAEFKTLMRFLDKDCSKTRPSNEDWQQIFSHFNAHLIVIRYGVGEISKQEARKYSASGEIEIVQAEIDTGFDKCSKASERRGFGDTLTADFLSHYYNPG